jgi:pimeloyl-ACP methyl ester carboxylesterase
MNWLQRALRSVIAISLILMLANGCSISYEPKPPRPDAALIRAHERKPAFVMVQGHRVYYVTTGTGPRTIVFVHGWAGNGNFWNEQVPALEDHARLVFIDLPGHGQSDKPDVDYTIDYLAEAVLGVINAVGAERVTLVGHSLGVAVICRVYGKAPAKVSALVAVEGSLRPRRMSAEAAEKLVAAYRAPNYREQVKQSVISMFPMPGTERLRQRVFDQMMLTPPNVLASTMANSLVTDDSTPELRKIGVPLLVINARSGGWTADYQAYVRSLSTQTEYSTLDRVGHFLMLEEPEQFNLVLMQMLARYDLITKSKNR